MANENFCWNKNISEVAASCITHFYLFVDACYLIDRASKQIKVFIVLRKNYRQLSFLHIYHHILMVGGVWVGIAHTPGGHLTFFGFLNSFVHIIMYTYYLMTSIEPKYKNYIGVKKWITRMQLAQFIAVFLHSAQVFFQPNCRVPRVLAIITMVQAVLLTALFSHFYYQTYIKKKKTA